MQPRTLLEVLVEVENILPEVRAVISAINNQVKKLLEGNTDVEIEDKGSSNLYNLLSELELKYKNTPRETLEKNIIARTDTAIHCGRLYINEIKMLMKKYVQTASRLLNGLFNAGNSQTSSTTFHTQANGHNTVQTLFQTVPVSTGRDAKPAGPATKTSNKM